MSMWVKHHMVPVFQYGRHTLESHGTLKSVWPGGLTSPTALLTALRQEKAVLEGCMIDEVGEGYKSEEDKINGYTNYSIRKPTNQLFSETE